MSRTNPKLNPHNITISYAAFAICWIWLSEAVLHHLDISVRKLFFLSALKGSLFIVVTTFGLYLVLRRMVQRNSDMQAEHEAELRESEGRFRAFMDNNPAIAWAKDEAGRYAYLNRTYESRFGISLQQVRGKTDFDLWPPETAGELDAYDQRVLASDQPLQLKERKPNTDGTFSTWRDIKFPFRDIKGNRFVGGIGLDITEAEATEAALRESEEQLQLFIKNAPAALAMFDTAMRYLRVSDRWLRDFNLADRNIIGSSHYDIFPEIPEHWKEAHRRGLAGDILRKEADRFERADGSMQWVRWEILPWHQRNGEIGGIVIFTEDITQTRNAEAELKQLQQEFYEAQKMEAIARLTGGIAHDFNNLLTVILAQSDLLQRTCNDERTLKRTKSIHDASLRAADLTRQLLAFSRKQVLEPSVQNVGQIVHGITDMLDRILGEDIHLKIRTGKDLWPVLVDRSQIEQVIMNLVVNARDAMPTGGELTLDAYNVQVFDEVSIDDFTLPQGNYVMLSVKDTGTGMTADVRKKIFEPFFTTKPHGKGTGLGLSTVFGIVKQSGGLVEVETELGKGTCFKIYFPHSNNGVHVVEKRQPYPVSGFHCSILLVDDEPELCSVMAEYLEASGHQVWTAQSLATALTIANDKKDQIDVIVTDMVLAEGNGKDLASRIKESGCKARKILMSGYTDDVIANHGALPPDVLYLQKPFGKDELLEKVWQAYHNQPQPSAK